jgi:hypothetical protein
LNRSTRFCRPLRNHSATWPHETDLLQTIKGLGNLLRRVRRQFLKSGFNAGWHRPRQFTKKARQPCRAFPRSGSRRPRLPSVKMVVHADAGDVFPGTPSVSDLELWRHRRRKISDRRVTAEVKVKVLDLGRPIVREHPFGAGARGPAEFGLADTGRRLKAVEPVCRSVNMAICQTARTIEQQIGVTATPRRPRTVPNHESFDSDDTKPASESGKPVLTRVAAARAEPFMPEPWISASRPVTREP